MLSRKKEKKAIVPMMSGGKKRGEDIVGLGGRGGGSLDNFVTGEIKGRIRVLSASASEEKKRRSKREESGRQKEERAMRNIMKKKGADPEGKYIEKN